MLGVSLSLNDHRHCLLRQSVQRYELVNYARAEVNHEFSKCITSVPNSNYCLAHKQHLLALQEAVNTRFGHCLHALGTIEQKHRQAVDAMFACATNALSDELEEAQKELLAQRAIQPLVRQDASSTGFKRARSSSTDPSGSESTSSDHDDTSADGAADGAAADGV